MVRIACGWAGRDRWSNTPHAVAFVGAGMKALGNSVSISGDLVKFKSHSDWMLSTIGSDGVCSAGAAQFDCFAANSLVERGDLRPYSAMHLRYTHAACYSLSIIWLNYFYMH